MSRDKDGRLSQACSVATRDFGEHFVWIDANSDGAIVGAEWESSELHLHREYGASAVASQVRRDGQFRRTAIGWRLQEEHIRTFRRRS
jgi:hypothetical protein